MDTPCRFRTNIDIMKRFMNHISGMPIEPNVGDLVRVHHDSSLDIYLQVVSRQWTFINRASPELICELHLPENQWESLEHFIKVMKAENIY